MWLFFTFTEPLFEKPVPSRDYSHAEFLTVRCVVLLLWRCRCSPQKITIGSDVVLYVNNCPIRRNYIQFIYICKPPYMFRVISPPIIRISCHCTHSIICCERNWRGTAFPVQLRSRQVAVTVLLLPDTVDTVTWAHGDGWRYQPKHVEQFTDINKLYIVASCWTVIAIYFKMHGPLNVKWLPT